MSSRALAAQMRDFAKTPSTQTLIVKDPSMMKSLLKFASAAFDPEITLMCAETFHLLAQSDACCAALRKRTEVVSSLEKMKESADKADSENAANISRLASETLAALRASPEDSSAAQGSDGRSSNTPSPTAAGSDSKGVLGAATARSAAASNTSYSSRNVRAANSFSSRGYLHPMVVAVHDLSEENRNAVEGVIIRTRGVVSVTIDVASKKAKFYVSAKPADMVEPIANALESAGFPCGKPTEIDPKTAAASGSSAGGAAEEGPGGKRKPGYVNLSACNNKDALVRYSKPNKKEENTGWLSSVTSYFW